MDEILWFLLLAAAVELIEELLVWRGDHLLGALNRLRVKSQGLDQA